jgi:hypothetical protein
VTGTRGDSEPHARGPRRKSRVRMVLKAYVAVSATSRVGGAREERNLYFWVLT